MKCAAVSDTSAVLIAPSLGVRHHSLSWGTILQLLPL